MYCMSHATITWVGKPKFIADTKLTTLLISIFELAGIIDTYDKIS